MQQANVLKSCSGPFSCHMQVKPCSTGATSMGCGGGPEYHKTALQGVSRHSPFRGLPGLGTRHAKGKDALKLHSAVALITLTRLPSSLPRPPQRVEVKLASGKRRGLWLLGFAFCLLLFGLSFSLKQARASLLRLAELSFPRSRRLLLAIFIFTLSQLFLLMAPTAAKARPGWYAQTREARLGQTRSKLPAFSAASRAACAASSAATAAWRAFS